MDTEKTDQKQAWRFQKGRSGNPSGRPPGARNRATVAAQALLDGESQALTRIAVDMALGGDTTALRLCLERILPPAKERPLCVELPAATCAADLPALTEAILQAVAAGT